MSGTKRTQTNPRSLANLKPAKPGECRNPGGRPKKKPITQAYEMLSGLAVPKETLDKLRLPSTVERRIKTYADLMAYGQMSQAIKGETPAAKEITDRMEGRLGPLVDEPGAQQITAISITVKYERPLIEATEIADRLEPPTITVHRNGDTV
jgi:hypothetical protein